MPDHVWLLPLKKVDHDARAVKLGEIALLELGEGQRKFVGEPLRMMLLPFKHSGTRSRWTPTGSAVGVFTLQSGAATLSGWPDG